MSLYNSQELHDVMTQIDQQLLRYFTACENEQHHLNVVEDAITGVLIPRVEELLAEDNMNGGEHSMSRKRNQGQMGLFYNGSAYVTNYQFARDILCDAYRKAGTMPFKDAKTVQAEGGRLLSMIEDLQDGGLNLSQFLKKYYREMYLVGKDKLVNGLGLALQRVAERGFKPDELVDVNAYQRGVALWVTADKKIMDSTLYMFIMYNQQALGLGRPRLENGTLFIGSEVKRYDIVYEFVLCDPEHSPDRMKFSAKMELVHDVLPDGSRRVQGFTVNFTPEESAKLTAFLKRVYFPADLGVKPHRVPVTIGEEFRDNYYFEYGTPEQKNAVSDKWASTDSAYRHMRELTRKNKDK